MLRVSECYESIQGEGSTIGVLAVFLRLAGCNLLCGGVGTVQSKKPEGGARWRCDTIDVWRKGESKQYNDLIDLMKQKGWYDRFKEQTMHLVVTGGEPLLQQKSLEEFLGEHIPYQTIVEVETNGTILPNDEFAKFVSIFNCSPKLANSGESYEKRVVQSPLEYFARSDKTIFKFVVAREFDCDEAMLTYVKTFNIPLNRVYFMPACQSRQELHDVGPQVVEWAKQKGVRYSTRLHIDLWDKKTGV